MPNDCSNSQSWDSKDLEIIHRVLRGDVNCYEVLLDRHKAHVATIVSNHVPREQVEEVAHDVFVNAYLSLATFKNKTTFRLWLSAIAVRTCYNYWRKIYRSRELPLSSLEDEDQDWLNNVISDQSQETIEEDVDKKNAQALLGWALDQLSPEERMVLELIHLEGCSVREAAALLGWSSANVKVRAYRSRKKILKILQSLPKGHGR
ncbi:MAG TPA: RNA polymerase sigma factor [Thermodesulfobacteriota bacterium]|nr:RNA polymerase sigma factor [Deltaproteobacteria bacterium]HNR11737.1 RNA polymerase sigma factor [Thermodesulfobacteriota bacterium]HQO78306.1 RNA polymerase sigma factor [Thermodesulfobacteriota bacterium]